MYAVDVDVITVSMLLLTLTVRGAKVGRQCGSQSQTGDAG